MDWACVCDAAALICVRCTVDAITGRAYAGAAGGGGKGLVDATAVGGRNGLVDETGWWKSGL